MPTASLRNLARGSGAHFPVVKIHPFVQEERIAFAVWRHLPPLSQVRDDPIRIQGIELDELEEDMRDRAAHPGIPLMSGVRPGQWGAWREHRRLAAHRVCHARGAPRVEGRAYSAETEIAFCLASSVFGSVTVKTPFLKVALIFSASTAVGRRTIRENAPWDRSTR